MMNEIPDFESAFYKLRSENELLRQENIKSKEYIVALSNSVNEFAKDRRALSQELDALKNFLSQNYIQVVPDKCDRIVWKNQYYRLGALEEMK